MRSRKFAGRLRAVRFSLTLLHWSPMGVLSLTPGSSQEKAGETVLSSLSTQKSFLLTDLHPQSPSCMLTFPSKIPPRQGYSEPPPLPLRLETAVFWQDASSLRLIGTDAVASREDPKAPAEHVHQQRGGAGSTVTWARRLLPQKGCVPSVG